MPSSKLPAEEPPPFLRTWPRVYAALAFYLLILIALLSALTKVYAP